LAKRLLYSSFILYFLLTFIIACASIYGRLSCRTNRTRTTPHALPGIPSAGESADRGVGSAAYLACVAGAPTCCCAPRSG
jgi:hypothetical protein